MKEYKFIIASVVIHVLFFGSTMLDLHWGEKAPEYLDSDVLLMGPNTGTKINPPKPKADKKDKVVKAPADPNAPKVFDKDASSEEPEEGTFGQGGTKPLDYFTELGAWLNVNKKYPKIARRLGHECDHVQVQFNIYPDGRLDDVIVMEKCQYDTLNQAAIETIKASSPFKPFPSNFPASPIKRLQAFGFKLEYN